MEYGKISEAELDRIDISLPQDPQSNKKVLDGNSGKPVLYMGTPKWGGKELIGTLYPKGTKDAQFLEQYVKHYNAIEFNATHYQIHPPQSIANWVKKAGDRNFRFCPKVVNSISHYSGFENGRTIDKGFPGTNKWVW